MSSEIPQSVVTGRRVAMILLVLAVVLTVAAVVLLIAVAFTQPATV